MSRAKPDTMDGMLKTKEFRPHFLLFQQYLEQWLQERSGRTFIFIGRDYDATMDYWIEVAKNATQEEQAMLILKLAD